jgi:hypothetical protein
VFQNLGVDQEDKYALVVYRNGTLYWIGRILADQMQYERRALVNTPFEITAVDGDYTDQQAQAAADKARALRMMKAEVAIRSNPI